MLAAAWPTRAVKAAYESLRDAAYDFAPLQELESCGRRAESALAAARLTATDRALWLSRVSYLMGRGFQARGHGEEAARHYTAGLDLAEQSMELGELSEGWRMMSENLGQLCVLGDLAYRLSYGPKVLRYARKAADLDPGNVAAQILLAAAKVYPPPIGGGNPALGLRLMRRALELDPAEPDDRFNVFSGIALACAKLGDGEEATRWFERALSLYPNNRYVREEYEKLSRTLESRRSSGASPPTSPYR